MLPQTVLDSVAEEVASLVVEQGKIAREFQIRVFWEAGELIKNATQEHSIPVTALVQGIAKSNHLKGKAMGERNLWMALKIYEHFPQFENVYQTEHGLNVTLTKLKKLLSEPFLKVEPTMEELAQKIYQKFGPEKSQELVEKLTEIIKAS